MQWEETLRRKCFEAMYKSGEVRIQFNHRSKDDRIFAVPIIRSYPNNQYVCDEVEIDEED